MLRKIDEALRVLLTQELGYTVEPTIKSLNTLADEKFPVCFFIYLGEDPVEEEDETIGFFTNNQLIDFEIAVLSGEQDDQDSTVSDYRLLSLDELSRFKKFINEARTLFEVIFPSGCIMEMQYLGYETLGFANKRAGGGIKISTLIKYRQSRTDPTSPFRGDSCN